MAKQSHSFSVKYVIVCDEIRREDTGKFIIIGVYGDNITVSRFPFDMTLAFWMPVVANKIGEISCQWRLTHDKFGTLSLSDGKVMIEKKEKESVISLRRVPVQLPEEGIVTLQVRESGGRWRTLKSIPVALQSGDS